MTDIPIDRLEKLAEAIEGPAWKGYLWSPTEHAADLRSVLAELREARATIARQAPLAEAAQSYTAAWEVRVHKITDPETVDFSIYQLCEAARTFAKLEAE